MKVESPNFDFLAVHDGRMFRLGVLAERYFADDPNTSMIKLRQFGEDMAQQVAAHLGLFESPDESQAELLRRLKLERAVPRDVIDLFHQVRIAGNSAVHEHAGDHRLALSTLKIARQLSIWFHRTFGNEAHFAPGPFVPPASPADASAALSKEIEALKAERALLLDDADRARETAREADRKRETAEARAQREAAERQLWAQLADEAEQGKAQAVAELRALQAQAEAASRPDQEAVLNRAEVAAQQIDLDEAATRVIIDQKLRDRGWEVDSQTLRFANGTRPVKGKAMAIAEWPTDSGPADYAFFVGTTCVAVAEAKRSRKNVSAAIDQAERYARGIKLEEGYVSSEGSWGEYRIPFVFATNGRPWLKQLETESGIWFRDVRVDTNLRRALSDWFTPEGLEAELALDRQSADQALKAKPFDFGFPLRPYQEAAIRNVEDALASGQREMLVAMATGTGKTKLSIALLYRLLSTRRFRRVCFVVDRNALGSQASGEFKSTKVVGPKAFGDIFDLKDTAATTPDPETRVHVCTIQGLVRRVLYNAEPSEVPPIDQYDLMVVDECHRGYLLDREMSDTELNFRSQDDYISKYRRVLEHFDAVKIGLTATPALHTVQIFGEPVYTYSYREAVIDGYLIDHEPPIRITTGLAQAGIVFHSGEEVEVIDPHTGKIDLTHMPDDISFAVDEFNKKVVTLDFNRVVAEELARHIDPDLPGKTLIFAVSDAHADIVVDAVKKAFADRYGEVEDSAVRKITGSVDRVGALIRSYRNDALPKVAVTVDLLTTGIDVPSITNLVFLRRVNSRILYEQMLGRATRPCPEIDKETFRIFDAVDLYPHLQELTAMRPVVVNPTVTLEQLFDELAQATEQTHQATVRDQILVKMRRRIRRLHEDARRQYEATTGETPEDTIQRLNTEPVADVSGWARKFSGAGRILDWTSDNQSPPLLPISTHEDRIVSVSRGYGESEKPEDYIDGFTSFIRNNVNQIAALTAVVQRPRELTRAQLRELRLELDKLGYSETNLRRAWQDARNEDIAASIVGYIRQAALGDPLVPYEERVRGAIKRILAKQQWTDPQRRWLNRIAEQITREVVVDRQALDEEPFSKDGGFRRLNRIFDGQLETILSDINEELWREAG